MCFRDLRLYFSGLTPDLLYFSPEKERKGQGEEGSDAPSSMGTMRLWPYACSSSALGPAYTVTLTLRFRIHLYL